MNPVFIIYHGLIFLKNFQGGTVQCHTVQQLGIRGKGSGAAGKFEAVQEVAVSWDQSCVHHRQRRSPKKCHSSQSTQSGISQLEEAHSQASIYLYLQIKIHDFPSSLK